ncbi:MAG TPA: glycosyltransferase [Chthoniobacterales bacterium]|nr:glycosyltransferase [Chthoniobacterales bacterium]
MSHETTLTGAPIQLLHLARSLHADGWRLTVVAPEKGPISDLLGDVPVVIQPGMLDDSGQGSLRELVAEFDVVVANTIVSWNAVRAARAENKPVIWYLHETLVAVRLIREIPEIAPMLHLATLLVTPTERTARVFQGLTNTPVEVVPYGIPDPLGVIPPKPQGEGTRFVTLASIEPRKGQDVLVEAIRKLPGDVAAQANFKLIGRFLEQPFADEVKEAAAGTNNIEFTGECDHETSLAALAKADVLVCPSRDETMPITILEAMGLGKGVVSTDVGGISEWLRDGSNGLLVPPNDPTALAHAIERLVTDGELLNRIGAAGLRTFRRHFRLERLAIRFGELFRDVCRSRPLDDPSIATGYEEWLRQFGDIDRVRLRRALRRLPRKPRISVILPVYNPPMQFLKAAIDSVRRQIYENWELCIADDASTDTGVRPFLEAVAREESRIRITFRERNGHISACSNSAIGLATGDWCALLDQDDEMAEHALATVALEIDRHPDAGLVFSDEDKIDENGVRSNPFFKPDWNPELFLGQNYINHLGVYRADLLREIGGFREGFEGSQDYDLALRCVARLRPEQVRHIPRILYHWRMVTGSLAAVPDAKPYAKEAARRAIADYCKRRQMPGTVVPCPENTESHRFIHAVPTPAPLASIIIPTRDRLELLERCVESIRARTDYQPYEIIIVDNGSVEERTFAFFRRAQSEGLVRVVVDAGPFNYSRLNNHAAAEARGDILVLLNNDTEIDEPGWLTEMVSHAARKEVGAVGARLWYPDGTLQHGGVILGLGGVAGHAFPRIPRGHPGYFNRAWLRQNCSAVTGACMAVRKAVFEELGGFDEQNLSVTFNDIDFCLRLTERGYWVVWTPYTNLIHHESASRGHQRTLEEQALFLKEAGYVQRVWPKRLIRDPFYNPNLSLNLPGFEIAFPPRVPDFSSEERLAVPAMPPPPGVKEETLAFSD